MQTTHKQNQHANTQNNTTQQRHTQVLGVMVSQRSHDGAPEYGAAQGAHFPGWEVHTRADAQRAAVLPAPAPAPAPAQAPP